MSIIEELDKIELLEELTFIQKQLIGILYDQVQDLSMMSKIELGDDVIEALNVLNKKIKNINEELDYE